MESSQSRIVSVECPLVIVVWDLINKNHEWNDLNALTSPAEAKGMLITHSQREA